MKNRINTMALLALAACSGPFLSGCAQTSPIAEANFGSSVRAAVASQVAEPAARSNADPVRGLDGNAAAAAQTRYVESYQRPAPPQSSIVGQLK